MKSPATIFIFFITVALISCGHSALIQMKKDNQAAEKRIAAKSGQLDDLQERNKILEQRKAALLSELTDRRITDEELGKALKKLRDENDRLITVTQIQKQRKQALDRQIREYEIQLDALNENGISLRTKEARLQDLKDTIRKYLTLDLAQ